MPAAKRFDLVVIGSGAAGEKGAVQAAYFGKRVAVIEREQILGGTRIHACALPSKALRETALLLSGARQRELEPFRVGIERYASMGNLMCHREPVVSAEVARVEQNFQRHGVRVIRGEAVMQDAHSLRVTTRGGATRVISADHFLIATGSLPWHPPGIAFNETDIVDTDAVLRLPRLPRSMIIAGAGVIGCELATMFAPLGVSVTLLEARETLLPFADLEVSTILADAFRKLGIDLRFRTRAEAVTRRPAGGVTVSLAQGKSLQAECTLFCAGRRGNTERLNLAAAGLATDDKGRLAVNSAYQTSVPHIYAAGDVIGFPGLASTSMEQARVAMCHAFALDYKRQVSPILPLGIYTIPEFSMVGESEASATQKGLAYEVGRAYYAQNPRGQLIGDAGGLLKLIFAVPSKRLLGAHIVGEQATELIHTASLGLQQGVTIDVFIDMVFNYPTLSELYKYAAYDGLGRIAKRGARQKTAAN